MKKTLTSLVLAVLCLGAFAQVKFTALEFTPAYPKPGDKITFTYNASYSPLKSEKKIEVVAYAFDDKNSWVALEPVMKKTGNTYSGSIQTNKNDNAVAFTFNAGENKDQNAGKGYVLPLYKDQQMVEDAYKTMSNLNMGMGEYLLGTKNDAEAGLKYLEEMKKSYPVLENDSKFMGQYLNAINSVKKKEATPIIEATLATIKIMPCGMRKEEKLREHLITTIFPGKWRKRERIFLKH